MDHNEKIKKLYDAACKDVLSEQGIAAYIMKTCVEEFKDTPIKEIIRYIQGKPEVGAVLVNPQGEVTRIETLQNEDKSETESTVTFDVRFTVLAPDTGEEIKLIINLEAQNDFHPGYPLIKRGVYYCARLISSQYGTVFTKSDYGKIQKVYSIWVCVNPTQKTEYSITSYHMKEKNIVGSVEADRHHYDLLNVVMICLGNKKYTELNGLLRLLNMMMVDNYLTKQEKRHILTDEFDIEITPELERGVDKMCNLSEGIEKKGFDKGREEGLKQGQEDEKLASARRMIAKGKFTAEDISESLDLPLKRIQELMQEQSA
ncbi:PD-(D/E)XK nuclease family transposase [Selenomonas ruminantium]|uniref:PD-(D/E)XK nuclease family transposase n=1 Tax=Selenomonas ruminantium TaxID=971 RepID=A0A1K1MID8_SELRU|nr:PD-(D/E)XK nuclease family transposase [Selenomonas ruminantium]SFW22888.1 conserved hypothetical protein (putative transposase or invertase) [Selenomonas ruminantium]